MMIIDHLCFFSSPPFLLDSDQYNFWSSNEQRSGGPAITCNQRKISIIFWQKSKNIFGQRAGWCHGTALCIFFWLLLDLATLSFHQIQKPKKLDYLVIFIIVIQIFILIICFTTQGIIAPQGAKHRCKKKKLRLTFNLQFN